MFNSIHIQAKTLDDGWHQILFNLNKYGRRYKVTSGSHAGSERLVCDFMAGMIEFPHTRPLAPIINDPDIPKPTTDDEIEKYFTTYLMDSHLEPGEEYRYSTWLVGDSHLKENSICSINQVEWVINHFKAHGFGNEHCYINVGNPTSCLAYDRPYKFCPVCKEYFSHEVNKCPQHHKELIKDETVRGTSPCLRGLDFAIRDNHLLIYVIYRSQDAYSGWPENMGGFTLLNEYIANELNVKPGPLYFSCKSLHGYSHHIDFIARKVRN